MHTEEPISSQDFTFYIPHGFQTNPETHGDFLRLEAIVAYFQLLPPILFNKILVYALKNY